ncbi:MAG: hypothetical protein LBQ15_00700 [Clostridium sp.]|jgi:hypothetical protein|nr:hypothetical protein [Clostridium sp.]
MKNLFWLDVRNILNSIEYKVVVGIYGAFSLYAGVLCFQVYIGLPYQFLRSADENFILQSADTSFLLYVMRILFPILSALLCAFQQTLDDSGNRSILAVQRCGRKRYLLSKAGAVSFMTFAGTTVPLLINFLLCHLVYPSIGYESVWAEAKYTIGKMSYSRERFLDMLRLEHPSLYNLSYVAVAGLMAAGIALLAFGLAMQAKKKAHAMVRVPFLLFFFYMFLNTAFQMAGLWQAIPANYLIASHSGSIACFAGMMALLLAAAAFLIRKGACDYEIL